MLPNGIYLCVMTKLADNAIYMYVMTKLADTGIYMYVYKLVANGSNGIYTCPMTRLDLTDIDDFPLMDSISTNILNCSIVLNWIQIYLQCWFIVNFICVT